jgi:hypothetical protein
MQQQHFYLRDESNRPFGVIALFSNPLTRCTQVGMSLCHKNDSFNKELGRKIAEGRAKAGREQTSFSISWDGPITLADLLWQLTVNPKLPKERQEKAYSAVMARMEYGLMSKTWKVAFQKSTPREEIAA